jgi:hypothetical protein
MEQVTLLKSKLKEYGDISTIKICIEQEEA